MVLERDKEDSSADESMLPGRDLLAHVAVPSRDGRPAQSGRRCAENGPSAPVRPTRGRPVYGKFHLESSRERADALKGQVIGIGVAGEISVRWLPDREPRTRLSKLWPRRSEQKPVEQDVLRIFGADEGITERKRQVVKQGLE
ncbi:hypothetical protein CERSUDRAFT_77400 [Gelatoporia subvermispora B]|uniref:Uncharacterized protein n=1 Tax=Ceriporiopsis subvermispora (strain B) TaxID=914234 RepID=M2QJT2_CERS8|nr:hypothetical protein CERSUDRAFT_77400 [Gelatoporia subvermispora B]